MRARAEGSVPPLAAYLVDPQPPESVGRPPQRSRQNPRPHFQSLLLRRRRRRRRMDRRRQAVQKGPRRQGERCLALSAGRATTSCAGYVPCRWTSQPLSFYEAVTSPQPAARRRHKAMPPRYCYEQPVARHRRHATVPSASLRSLRGARHQARRCTGSTPPSSPPPPRHRPLPVGGSHAAVRCS